MRKALIAAAVATALFAVGAFAASFTVRSEDIASGANDVDRCAANVDITFNDPTPPASPTGDWTVSTATATFYNADPLTPVPGCDGFSANLSLLVNGLNVNVLNVEVGDPTSGVVVFTIPGGANVGQITRASVAVDGVFLPTTFIEP